MVSYVIGDSSNSLRIFAPGLAQHSVLFLIIHFQMADKIGMAIDHEIRIERKSRCKRLSVGGKFVDFILTPKIAGFLSRSAAILARSDVPDTLPI
jgi:hypothetical protein